MEDMLFFVIGAPLIIVAGVVLYGIYKLRQKKKEYCPDDIYPMW